VNDNKLNDDFTDLPPPLNVLSPPYSLLLKFIY
jgi:hypothetical protein